MAGAGEEEHDDQEQKVRELNGLMALFKLEERTQADLWDHRQTTSDDLGGERSFYTPGRGGRGTGEAEQMEETRATEKVGEPMNTPDRHEWKWQKGIQIVCS